MKEKIISVVCVALFAAILTQVWGTCIRDEKERKYREETDRRIEEVRERARAEAERAAAETERAARLAEQEAMHEYETKRAEISSEREELVMETVRHDDGVSVDDGLRGIAEDAYRRFVCEPAAADTH